jgi:H+/Cl- antiporter ClcA
MDKLDSKNNTSLLYIISGIVLFIIYFFQGPILRLIYTDSVFDFIAILFVLGIGNVLYLCGSLLVSLGLVNLFFKKRNSNKFLKYSFGTLIFIALTLISQLFLFK